MCLHRITRFMREEHAAVTVEFVALMPVFMLIAFFIMEVGVIVFWLATAEKAVQIGARLAIVSNSAAIGVPTTNDRFSTTVIFGTSCSVANTCATWSTITCTGGTGGTCNAANFAVIAARMRAIFNVAEDQYITIQYADSQLGFAGGPAIPRVTVSISGIPYNLVLTSIMSNFLGDSSPFVSMPNISATMTGEDMSTVGAS